MIVLWILLGVAGYFVIGALLAGIAGYLLYKEDKKADKKDGFGTAIFLLLTFLFWPFVSTFVLVWYLLETSSKSKTDPEAK